MTTTEDRQYNYYPPGLNRIETATIDNETTVPPLIVVHSQQEWDFLNSMPNTTGIPTHIFPRAFDFGLFPVPQEAYLLTLVGSFYPINMSADDYITGTVSIANNSRSLVGTDTVWTESMQGRYFTPIDSDGESIGNFYRLGLFGSTTTFTLETYFEDLSLTNANYKIGESPQLPLEAHEFIPHRVASIYYATRRRDTKLAQKYSNFYWTGDWDNSNRKGVIEGGILGIKQQAALLGSDNSQILDMSPPRRNDFLAQDWERITT